MTNQDFNRNSDTNSQVTPPSEKKPPYLLAGVIGVLLLAIIGVLSYQGNEKTVQLDTVHTEVSENVTLQTELESQYQEAIAELDGLSGTNAKMNELIEAQKGELTKQKNRIATLIKGNASLASVRKEMESMKASLAQYVADIETLKMQNQELGKTKQQLMQERDTLDRTLRTKITENTELSDARALLVSETEELAKSVKIGSVIQVRDVRVEGLKVRSNGKVKQKASAKRIDQLKVCFTTVANEVAQPGLEQFHVRVINPKGETLAVAEAGDAFMTNEKTGEEVHFTQSTETQYANDEQFLCLTSKPDVSFSSGKYVVEVYNKGYLAGTGSFELK